MATLHPRIKNLLRKSYELTYIYQGENLNGHAEEFESAVQSQDWSHIDEILEKWEMWEREADSMDYIIKELINDICNEFDVEEERAKIFVNRWEDEIKGEIYTRDNSTPLKDLLRYTDDSICYYDTGLELDQTWNFDEKEYQKAIKDIKRVLKIKIKDSSYDKQIRELIANASYGGRLLIFFKGDIEEMMSLSDKKKVTFSDYEVGLIDYGNGSGHNVEMRGAKFSLPLDVKNIGFDLSHRYNYTDAVCAMYHNWCDCTKVKFS